MTTKKPDLPAGSPGGALPQDEWLDRALSSSLRPPELPPGFHAALMRALERENENEVLVRRRALEADYERRVAQLRSGYVRLRSETLAIALAIAVSVGAGASAVLPWLATAIGTDVVTLAPAMAALLAVGLGVAVARFRLRLTD